MTTSEHRLLMAMGLLLRVPERLQQVRPLMASVRVQRLAPCAEFQRRGRIRKYTTQLRDSRHGGEV